MLCQSFGPYEPNYDQRDVHIWASLFNPKDGSCFLVGGCWRFGQLTAETLYDWLDMVVVPGKGRKPVLCFVHEETLSEKLEMLGSPRDRAGLPILPDIQNMDLVSRGPGLIKAGHYLYYQAGVNRKLVPIIPELSKALFEKRKKTASQTPSGASSKDSDKVDRTSMLYRFEKSGAPFLEGRHTMAIPLGTTGLPAEPEVRREYLRDHFRTCLLWHFKGGGQKARPNPTIVS